MVETLSVSVSGLAFSLLLYENAKSNYDQEGFLLGEIITREKSKVTDADQEVVNIEKVIHINSVVTCPQQCYFYDQAGRIDVQKINDFLGGKASKVVAWYKYKAITSFKMTLREKIIHKQLADLFKTDLFSMCMLVTNASDNFATHSFFQTFIRYCDDYQPVPLHIINLSQKNDYYKVSEPLPKTFDRIVKSLNIDLEKSQGLVVANKIQVALQKHIDQLVASLDESEKELFELEQEVLALKRNLKWKSDLNCSLGNGFDNSLLNGENMVIDNYVEEISDTSSNSSEKKPKAKGPKGTAARDPQNSAKSDTAQPRTRSRAQKQSTS